MDSKYDIVYDEAIVSYLELYCFLGAYFQYTVCNDESRDHAINEVVNFCTTSYIQRVITQIDTLLVVNKTDDETLMQWLGRISEGRNYETPAEARSYLLELQASLKRELQKQLANTPTLSYASASSV